MILKFFTNIILVRNQNIGINGAAIGNIVCNLCVVIIGFIVLEKNIDLKIDAKNFILKPIFATFIMSITLIFVKFLLKGIIADKMVTILAIASATISYGALVMALKMIKKK